MVTLFYLVSHNTVRNVFKSPLRHLVTLTRYLCNSRAIKELLVFVRETF